MSADSNKPILVLASKSPRRKELLGRLGIPFIQKVADLEEVSDLETFPEICKDIAHQKGVAVSDALDTDMPYLIVSSDTMVCLGQVTLGKPKDKNEAREFLSLLSGKEHEVLTAVCLKTKNFVQDKTHSFVVSTKVKFSEIEDDLMDYYLGTGESLDKAGAYGIQSFGLLFVESLQGSYSNVVGFPLSHFRLELKDFLQLSLGYQGTLSDFFESC